MSWSALKSPVWEKWLLAVAGKKTVRPGIRLDPFGTSWRTLSTQARPWLSRIRSGGLEASERRTNQTLIDLRAAGLVQGGGGALTALGGSVLARWEVFPDEWEFELPLAVALLQEGLAYDDSGFCEMLEFWWDVRRVFDEEELLSDRETVLLLPYLNQTVEGFNPWVELRDGTRPVPPRVPWKDLKNAVESDLAKKALARLQDRLDPSRRLAGRVSFCRGMSLLFEARQGGMSTYLTKLKLPYRSSR